MPSNFYQSVLDRVDGLLILFSSEHETSLSNLFQNSYETDFFSNLSLNSSGYFSSWKHQLQIEKSFVVNHVNPVRVLQKAHVGLSLNESKLIFLKHPASSKLYQTSYDRSYGDSALVNTLATSYKLFRYSFSFFQIKCLFAALINTLL